ncbi:MAG: division/cell wall cluster transcriptional repressor MraZ [Candidatus Neomarinimicrobiota bacterium]
MTVNQNTFTGEYSYSVDSKGRINIPAKYRQVLSADNESTFVITRGQDACVWVYPAAAWKQIEDQLKHLSSLKSVNRSFVRSTVRHAASVKYDKQGRIALTPYLIDYASLEKEVLIIGMVNKIEIWNPALLEKIERETKDINAAEFDELANQITL